MRCALLVATGLLSCGLAVGQDSHSVRVHVSGAEQVSAHPGDIVTAAFTVTNDTAVEQRFVEALALPSGWQLLQPLSDFPLQAGASETRLVSLAVRRSAQAATYPLTYTVRAQGDSAVQDQSTIRVMVVGLSKIEALADSKSLAVVAGSAWETPVRVVNRGNVAVSLRATAEAPPGNGVTVEPSGFSLAAGGQQVVVVKGRVRAEEARSRTLSIPVLFTDAQNEKAAPLASITLAVSVIARQTGTADLSRRIPTEFGVRMVGGPAGSGLQAQWSGAGFLDEEGKRKVSFLLRGPDTQNDSVFGLDSEAHVNYSDPGVEVSLGDQTYGLSYLTEYMGYGRGAGLDWRMGSHDETSLYSYRSATGFSQFRRSGLRVQHSFDRRWQLATNLLSQQSDADDLGAPAESGTIGSLELLCRPSPDAQVRLEVGSSHSDRHGGDTAYDAEVRGELPNGVAYSFHKLRAGADYAGSVHDRDLSSVSLSAPVPAGVRLSASFNEYRSNLEHRAEAGSAPVERSWQVAADRPLSPQWSAGLSGGAYRRRDALEPGANGSEQQALGLSLARSDANSSLRATLSRGRYRDLSTGAVSNPWSLELIGVYRPGTRCTFTAFGGLGEETGYEASALLGLSSRAGFSVDWQARPDFSCSLWYTDQRPAAVFNAEATQAQLLLAYRPPSGQSWEVQLRRSAFGDGPVETSYSVAYTLPFSLAVGRRHDIGVLAGRLFDAEKPQHPGLAAATVIVDGQAVSTDVEGRFVVGGLRPGPHHLQVDRASIGLQRVTTVLSPVAVEITGGQVSRLELGVVTAASVAGVVAQRSAVSPAQPAEVTGAAASDTPVSVAGLLVELTGAGESRQCLSDTEGRFSFEGLRPGAWSLKVAPAGLPAHYFIERSQTELKLQPAQRYVVRFEIVEQARRIRMIAPVGPETLLSSP